jgi:serine/threonine protein kinase/beta-lactam-binding protein with PASTA domain
VDRTVADPVIGRVLDGRYRVGPRIARGGMATVYEATDLRLDRVVALKVMHAGLGDDDDFAGRFVREARSAARLSHPHVVAVFDQGDDDGTLFLAMEYIQGHTLRDLIRKEAPMAPAKALALIDPVLSALGAAHQAGLIHRDVKPENVLLAQDGRVKVADFGLARAVSAETQHTATGGVLIGTVSYLSPELVVDGRADARSDVYAAGVVLYEMLTGRKPHEGDSPIQVAYKHVHEDVPPPSDLVPSLPAYVDALVARATARERDLRPADARVLLHQVRRVRAALDHGVADDPELTSDLTPTVPVQRLSDDIDYIRDEPDHVQTILSPAQVSRAARSEDTSVIGARPAARPPAPPRDERPAQRPPQRPAKPRRSRRGPVLLVVVLLLAVAAAAGGWWLGDGRYITTPGVLNMSASAAEKKVEAEGLSFRIGGRAYSETVTTGSVMRTDPAGGENVTRSGTVTAILSRGPERHAVPVVRGRTLDDAQAAIQDADLSFGTARYVFNETVAKGVVLQSDPKPGARLRRDAAVDVVVSKGPKPIKVPDFTGHDADRAEQWFEKAKVEVERSEDNSDTVEKGDVLKQSPDKGTVLPGDKVELVVSKGPVMVNVPQVIRMNTGDATAELKAAGFEVRTERVDVYIGIGLVVRQSPGSGGKAPRGSTVTIYIV